MLRSLLPAVYPTVKAVGLTAIALVLGWSLGQLKAGITAQPDQYQVTVRTGFDTSTVAAEQDDIEGVVITSLVPDAAQPSYLATIPKEKLAAIRQDPRVAYVATTGATQTGQARWHSFVTPMLSTMDALRLL